MFLSIVLYVTFTPPRSLPSLVVVLLAPFCRITFALLWLCVSLSIPLVLSCRPPIRCVRPPVFRVAPPLCHYPRLCAESLHRARPPQESSRPSLPAPLTSPSSSSRRGSSAGLPAPSTSQCAAFERTTTTPANEHTTGHRCHSPSTSLPPSPLVHTFLPHTHTLNAGALWRIASTPASSCGWARTSCS